MELYRFNVTKNGRQYVNFVLVWKHNEKVWYAYQKPSFRNDFKMMYAVAKSVKSYDDIVALYK
jgi:hypothetical protein